MLPCVIFCLYLPREKKNNLICRVRLEQGWCSECWVNMKKEDPYRWVSALLRMIISFPVRRATNEMRMKMTGGGALAVDWCTQLSQKTLRMVVLWLALILGGFTNVPTGILGNPDAKRLYDDLLSNYNRLIRPVGNNSDRLTVKMGLKLSQLIDVVSVIYQTSFSPSKKKKNSEI